MAMHFFDATNNELMDASGELHPVPFAISEAAAQTDDVDIVYAWAVMSGVILRGDSVAMLASTNTCAA